MTSAESASDKHNSSTQVSFSRVHEYVLQRIGHLDGIPMLGTPAWCDLADDDPRKEAAVLDGGQHWALRLEQNQEALAEASKAIAAAADWKAVAQELSDLHAFRAKNPWAKRVAS